jgi:hypothetical protein
VIVLYASLGQTRNVNFSAVRLDLDNRVAVANQFAAAIFNVSADATL